MKLSAECGCVRYEIRTERDWLGFHFTFEISNFRLHNKNIQKVRKIKDAKSSFLVVE
jgi:hypothetical protein